MIIPITRPAWFSSGPPESPGSIPAFVSTRLVSVSLPPWSSLATICLWSPVTTPVATVTPPRPPALPRATTAWPTFSFDELPSLTVFRPVAVVIWSTATSSEME